MEGKLIKTSKDSYHNGHYFLNDDNGFAIGSSDKDWCKRAVKKRPLYVLSLTNCQAIERGYDLVELAKKYCTHEPKNTKELRDVNLAKLGFIDGFQKALEILGDKKFSGDDMAREIHLWDCHINVHEEDKGCLREIYKRVKALQQTEWDVTFDPEEKDAEGRLILKRK